MIAVLVIGVTGADAEKKPPVSQITIEYTPPTKAGVIGIPIDQFLRMRVLIELLESQIQLPHPLQIVYRQCGSGRENAYYYRSIQQIEVCHEFWDKRRALYLQTGHDRETVNHRLRNSMTFTVFHEIGHALKDQLKLPLLGNEEDAVDDIATLWMIRLGVGEAAKHAAYGHHLRAKQPEYGVAFWDEHNNGARRGFQIACLLYGSDPGRYVDVFRQMDVPAPHITRCTEEYADSLAAWTKLLGPHLTR